MTQPIRMLQLSNEAGPLKLFTMPICDAFRNSGYEVELACMTSGPLWDALKDTDYTLHKLTPGSWSNPLTWWRTYRQLRRRLRRGRYDVMVVHTPVMSWIARFAARGLVGKVVYLAHGLPFAPVQSRLVYHVLRWVEGRLARYTDAVIVMNQADAEACQRYRMTRPSGKWYRVAGEGVAVEDWETPPAAQDVAALEQQLQLRPDRPLVAFLGRFIATKRPDDVLEVARRVGDRADFVLAGYGPLWERTRRRARRIGPHVHVVKFVHQVRALMRRCTLLVMPSVFREGMPRVLLEAQLVGKVPIAYDVRGSSDAIDSGRTGLLVPPRDVDAFGEAVQQLLDDEQLRQRMGQAGRQRVREQFSFEVIAAQHVEIIRQVMEQAR